MQAPSERLAVATNFLRAARVQFHHLKCRKILFYSPFTRRSKVRFDPAYFLQKISRPPAPLPLLFAKSRARLTCSVVNALTTVRCRYQLFASCVGVSPPAKTVKTSPPQAAYRLRRLFCKSRRVRSLRCSSFPKKVTPRLRCSLAGALATRRLATSLFRAASAAVFSARPSRYSGPLLCRLPLRRVRPVNVDAGPGMFPALRL